MRQSVSTFHHKLAIPLIFGLSSCAISDSNAPSETTLSATSASPKLVSSTLAGKSITVWQDGLSYTLNVDARAISISDGSQLLLDTDLTAEFATTFQAIVEGDVLNPAMEDVACAHPEMCVDPYSVGGDRTKNTTVKWYGSQDAAGKSGLGVRVITPQNQKPNSSSDGYTISSTDMCGDIAGVMLQTTSDFREKRRSWLYALGQLAVETAAAYPISRNMAVAVVAIDAAAGLTSAHIQMGMYATLWNGNYCDNRTVQASGFIILGGAPSTDGVFKLVCTWQNAWIQVGNDSKYVEVHVCHYETQ